MEWRRLHNTKLSSLTGKEVKRWYLISQEFKVLEIYPTEKIVNDVETKVYKFKALNGYTSNKDFTTIKDAKIAGMNYYSNSL